MDKHQVKIVTIALLLSNAMSGLDNTIINTALPRIIADLQGIEFTGWMVAIFLLGTAVATPLWSKLAERKGNKLAYQLAAAVFLLGALLQGAAPNMYILLASRLIAGLGNGGMVSIPYIIYSDLYPDPRERMKTLGLVSAFYTTATIMGPMVGGWIVDAFSWRWVFYLNIPFALLSIILVQIYFAEQTRAVVKHPIDFGGAICLTFGLISLLIGTQMIEHSSLSTIFLLFASALIFLGMLTIIEKQAKDPIIPSHLFKNRPLMLDLLLFVLIWAAMSAYSVYAPMWAQGLLATSAFIGGVTQMPGAFTDLLGALSVEPLRRKFSAMQVVVISTTLLLLGYLLMAFAPMTLPYWAILVAGMLQGAGNGIVFNELQVKVQQDAEKKDVPVATSFSFLVRMISQSVAASIFGLILNSSLIVGTRRFPAITIEMMNHLSDAVTAASLPQHLLPAMRNILYAGIHQIFLVALIFIVLAMIVSLYGLYAEKIAQSEN